MPPLTLLPDTDRPPEEVIDRALATVREHLGMEIAYLSEFVGGRSVFRAVNAPGLGHLIAVGDSRDLNDVYCQHILDGRLPELIRDTGAEPLCRELPITTEAPIGSHVSVPIRRKDGSIYGMFCCLSPMANPTLTPRDLSVMRAFADLAGDQINGAMSVQSRHSVKVAAIEAVIEMHALGIVYQPIVDLAAGRVKGVEALSRFGVEPYRSPDKWFADAASVGLGVDLELAAIAAALDGLGELPEGVYMSVNAGPATVSAGRLGEVLTGMPLGRIVLELTEHDAIETPEALIEELSAWRRRGLRVAIDDAGAGHSGLQQIIRIAPDILKLDRALVTGIDADPVRRSLVAAMAHFARETGAAIVAEGVETDAERRALQTLGIDNAQGWLFGRPAGMRAALAAAIPGHPALPAPAGQALRVGWS